MSKMPLVATIYNPQTQSRESLIENFVVRIKLFKKLFKEIETSKMQHPEQHYLLVGKRGMGKTTLLLRLAYEIERTNSLNERLLPLVFNEEEYGIRKLYKFWVRVAELLEGKSSLFHGLSAKIDELSAQYKDDEEYEKAIFELLANALKEHQKKIILFIDNIGDIFEKFNQYEAHRLRKILQTSADIRILGASSKVIEAFYDVKYPFYEFFKMEELKGLQPKETNDLLLRLGRAYGQEKQIQLIFEQQKGRVETLRRLTGGVTRTIVLLFEIFIDEQNGDAFQDLETILDRVTPLYKHRMDDLPSNQQEIVEAIALHWDAMNVKEIRHKTRMEGRIISAQLAILVKNGIINRKLTTTKNHLYELSERFFNIWYLMRCGRKSNKQEVVWLIRIFESWCSPKELELRVKKHIDYLKSGKYGTKAAFYVSSALAAVKHLPSHMQDELLKTTRSFLEERDNNLSNALALSDIEIFEKLEQLNENKDKKEIIQYQLQLKTDAKFYLLALAYEELFEDNENAKKYYLKALVTSQRAKSLINLGWIYFSEDNNQQAYKYYRIAYNEGEKEGIETLGLICYQLGRTQESKKYFEAAIEIEEHGQVTYAMLGYINEELELYNKAVHYFTLAYKAGETSILVHLGKLYRNELNDFEKAEQYFKVGIENDMPSAYHQLAHLYEDFYDDKEAEIEELYKKAIELGDEKAKICLGGFYSDIDRLEETIQIYQRETSQDPVFTNMMLGIIHLWEYEDVEQAEHYLLKWLEALSIEKLPSDDEYYEAIIEGLTYLISREKYKELSSFFGLKKGGNKFKIQLKPIYYTLMYYLQDKYPNEYLRMGEELRETVEEIIAKVEEMRIKYE